MRPCSCYSPLYALTTSLTTTLTTSNANLGSMMVASYGLGAVTSVTPCSVGLLGVTLPVITMADVDISASKSSSESDVEYDENGGEAGSSSVKRLTLYYLGQTTSYLSLALIAAILSNTVNLSFNTIFGNDSFKDVVAGVILIGIGGSMLGVLPSKGGSDLVTKIQTIGDKIPKAGGPNIPFTLGLTSGLLGNPCGAPVLTTLLVYLSTYNDFVLGLCCLACYALGNDAVLILGVLTGGKVEQMFNDDGGSVSNAKDSGNELIKSLKRNKENISSFLYKLAAGIAVYQGTNIVIQDVLGDPSVFRDGLKFL